MIVGYTNNIAHFFLKKNPAIPSHTPKFREAELPLEHNEDGDLLNFSLYIPLIRLPYFSNLPS